MRFLFLSLVAAAAMLHAQAPGAPAARKAAAAPRPAVAAPATAAPDMKKVEAMIRNIEGWTDQVQVKIDSKPSAYLTGFSELGATVVYNGQELLQRQYFLSKDGKLVRGSVHDLSKHPFQADLDKLKTELQPSFGAPGAKVVVAVFSDFQCPACRQEAKEIREHMTKEFPNDVRVYYKDFPLTMIHPWSMSGAIAGRCIFRANPEAFWDFHDWIFDKQTEITPENLQAKITEWASSKGVDTLQLTRCMESRATEKEVRASMAEGLSLGIDRTPTLFINGRKMEASQWQTIANVIRYELDYQKTAANAGEKCCEVTIPGMVKQK